MIRLPIGETDFRAIRSSGSYYVDKTDSISTLIRDGANAIQFTRPRRFGKTTFQSMLSAFFDIREDNKDIFQGLAIMDDAEAVDNWMNKYPVIFLIFKDIDGLTFDSAFSKLRAKITELFQTYGFLEETCTGDDESVFRMLLSGASSVNEISQSLYLLAKLLYLHYGRKVIIILDEYDVPLDKAEKNGYYPEMLDTMRSMLLSVLKDCPYTEKGILTGCLRISKESLFTGLNNLAVYSVTGKKYTDAFGFTEEEVKRLLSDLNILQTDRNSVPENYWANSSGNDAIKRLIDIAEAEVSDDYSVLINGGTIKKHIIETLTYADLYSSAENIWSLLLMTGYLTLAGTYYPNGETELRLPNEEIRNLFAYSVNQWFLEGVEKSNRKPLFKVIWAGDETKLSEIISQYLFTTISYYDYKEDYYHAFLAGLLSGAGYTVKSNRETGIGRADIILFDKDKRRAAIFEIKRSLSMDELDKDAETALQQIHEKEYGLELEGYRTIIRYGVAFCRKTAKVMKY